MILSYPFSEQILLAASAMLVLLLPGLLWVIFKNDGRDLVERLADSIGLSISSVAILGMIFFFLDWRFSGGLIAVLLTSMALVALYLFIHQRIHIPRGQLMSWATAY